VMGLTQNRRVIRLFQAALTNFPALDGMDPVVAKQDLNGGNAANQKEETIKMENILKALGLAATATIDEAVAAITSLKETAGRIPVACKGVLAALGLKDGANDSDKTSELSTMVKTLSDKLAARDVEELVQVAMKAGKITGAQLDWARNYAKTDPEGFNVFAAKAPAVVPMGTDHHEPAPKTEGEELNIAEVMVCKQLSINAETFKKHNKKA
jgi:phage I-like protein